MWNDIPLASPRLHQGKDKERSGCGAGVIYIKKEQLLNLIPNDPRHQHQLKTWKAQRSGRLWQVLMGSIWELIQNLTICDFPLMRELLSKSALAIRQGQKQTCTLKSHAIRRIGVFVIDYRGECAETWRQRPGTLLSFFARKLEDVVRSLFACRFFHSELGFNGAYVALVLLSP